MALNLYNIEKEYIELTELLIENGGELTPELEERLVINSEQIEQKGRGYGFVIKQLANDIKTIKEEKKRLDALLKSRENASKRLKEVLTNAMNLHDITEIKTETLKINFRKSESVEVENPDLLTAEFKKVTVTPDKTAIKKQLKAGEIVIGAKLVENRNIQIK
jgi:hypothetical protein